MKGELRQNIAGKDVTFKEREICLIGKDSIHAEYLFRKKSIVLFLGISNSFFDGLINLDTAGSGTKDLSRESIAFKKGIYQFIRFVPLSKTNETQSILEEILCEMSNPRSGSRYIVMGCVERLAKLLPEEYQCSVEKYKKPLPQKLLFENIQGYLNLHYKDVSIRQLSIVFNYSTDYFNRIIRRYTGLSYSKFLQQIRLEKAEYLLRTTQYSVEYISRQVGYENFGYFYKIFYEKYRLTPKELRKNVEKAPVISQPGLNK
jgi:AraC-like DNA-binding protein